MIAAFVAFLRLLVASLQVPLPTGLVIVEASRDGSYVRHTARVRRVGDFVEVFEDVPNTPASRHVGRRLYHVHAILQIRDLTREEWAAVAEGRRLRARLCRHCGERDCPDKGTNREHMHYLPTGRETHCEVSEIHLRGRTTTERAAVTCPDCLDALISADRIDAARHDAATSVEAG